MRKLKRAVIKEELVELTGDFKKAIVLNQMIYWSERTKDVDKFILDEKRRAQMAMGNDEIEYAQKLDELDLMTHGWIYKSAEELSEETMMGVSKSTMGRYLNELVEEGWLHKRKNPKWKGDNTYQYRVDLLKIQKDLLKLGYSLEGYSFDITEFQNDSSTFDDETSQFQNETTCSKMKQPVSKSNYLFQNETTLPEITTEINNKDYSNNLSIEKEIKKIDNELVKNVLIWNKDRLIDDKIKIDDVITSLEVNKHRIDVNEFARILNNVLMHVKGTIRNITQTMDKSIENELKSKKAKQPTKEIVPEWFDERKEQRKQKSEDQKFTLEDLRREKEKYLNNVHDL